MNASVPSPHKADEADRRRILEETARLVKDSGVQGVFIETNVTQEADVQAMVEKAIATLGRPDFAFNNAGAFGESASLIKQTQDQYDRLMDVNVKGVWLSMKYEAAQMLRQGAGVRRNYQQ